MLHLFHALVHPSSGMFMLRDISVKPGSSAQPCIIAITVSALPNRQQCSYLQLPLLARHGSHNNLAVQDPDTAVNHKPASRASCAVDNQRKPSRFNSVTGSPVTVKPELKKQACANHIYYLWTVISTPSFLIHAAHKSQSRMQNGINIELNAFIHHA